MPNVTRSRWAGVPAADRRAERRSLLIGAAFNLLGTDGLAGTTVRAVCQAAQLNPRYFYESFDDLDSLIVAVYDELVDELRAEIEVAMAAAGSSREAQLRATVESTVRFIDEDRRRGRVLYGEALGSEALNRRRIESGFAVADAIAARGDPRQRIRAAVVVGGFTEVLMAWLDGRIKVTRKQLVDETTDAFLELA